MQATVDEAKISEGRKTPDIPPVVSAFSISTQSVPTRYQYSTCSLIVRQGSKAIKLNKLGYRWRLPAEDSVLSNVAEWNFFGKRSGTGGSWWWWWCSVASMTVEGKVAPEPFFDALNISHIPLGATGTVVEGVSVGSSPASIIAGSYSSSSLRLNRQLHHP